MGILKTGLSAIGKLLMLVALAGAFVVGAVSAVYLSLRGDEVKVPEVIGKDFYASEKDIAALGLKLKKRATRYSEEKPNTILEQLPKPGETVKTGQTILVVTSEVNPEGSEAPAVIQKPTTDSDEDESTDITPDKPKTNSNTKAKKPAQSTRDVISNKANANSNAAANANPANSAGNTKTENGGNKNSTPPPPNAKPSPQTNTNKSEPAVKPAVAKPSPVSGGDVRTRRVP